MNEAEQVSKERGAGAEVSLSPGPRIYVASLGDYNAGRLRGIWLDATLADDELAQAVQAMLATSPEPGAEEVAIHDYEGFGPIRLHEYASLSSVAYIGRGIGEHGPAFAHWASIVGIEDLDALGRFEDAYRGQFGSVEEYAESLIEDFGWQRELDDVIPEFFQPYLHFDVEAFARDLELSGDITASPTESGGVYVFEGTV